jgi:hypothetical protein
MSRRRLADTVVVGLTSLAVLPLAVVFGGENLRWLEGGVGTLVLLVVVLGLIAGFLGGIALAIARKNPLWLIATVSASCVGYVWLLVAMGIAIGHMH